MAVCEYCDQEMLDHVSCTLTSYEDFPDGVSRERITSQGQCHDCGAPSGGLHHPGCDVERCPLCGGQAIACNCVMPPAPLPPAADDPQPARMTP